MANIERLLEGVLQWMNRGVGRDTWLVTWAGSKPYSVKKPRLERAGASSGMDRVD